MPRNDLASRAQEMTAGLFGPSLPELQAGTDQEGRRGGTDQEERACDLSFGDPDRTVPDCDQGTGCPGGVPRRRYGSPFPGRRDLS